MKTSFVSSSAISQAMRYQMMRMQAELVEKQQEAISGRVADPGVALGAGVSRTVSMSRDIERLKGLVDSNKLASNRLSATQDALGQMSAIAQNLLSTLTSATSDVVDSDIVREEAVRALGSLTSILNSNLNGEYLFAGINTDVRPIGDFSDPGSEAKAKFDEAFFDHFGFSQTDPAASGITAAAMEDFLTTVVEPQFLGDGWKENWSNATDERIVTRIATNETAETSVTANVEGVRKLMMVATTVSDLLAGPLNEAARGALYERALTLVGEGLADLGDVQAQAGVAENRISDASERITTQVDLFRKFVTDLEGVDPYEASTRVTDLLTQIEASYTLTARIQQLSLVRFLP